MAASVMFKRPCLRGSRGGTPVRGPQCQKLLCAICLNRKRTAPAGTHGD